MSDNNQIDNNQNQQYPQNPSSQSPNSNGGQPEHQPRQQPYGFQYGGASPGGASPGGFQPGGPNMYGGPGSTPPQMPQVVPSPGFVESIKLFFSQYATFSGRSRRSEFWYAMLFQVIVGFALSFFQQNQLSNIVSLVFLIPNLSLQCRRLHDIGRSGNWIWTQVLAYVFLLIALMYMVVFVIFNIPEVKDQYINMGIDVTVFYGYSWLLNIPGLVIAVMVLVALALTVTLLVFNCMDSQKGTNQYGPSPKYPDATAVPPSYNSRP